MNAIEILLSILIVTGGLLTLLGAIGLIRLPDVYSRTHAVAKSATLGVISIMLAVFLFFLLMEGIFSIKILLVIFFVFLTAPIAGLMISRSAYRTGVPLWEKSVQDDLKKLYSNNKQQSNMK